ncbi:spermatogenesis- and oogenesis-specific basic helix-loop-helix-containing protein 1 isoform X1 [Sciurus carolinensis]|uniref:spermatogenesis- and oogenesis-specific basic helix-loop-helix-containing protein 1 isoform X1 n=1 Tax=Sciurus carolinensis TaxID=30640 RepID=UPI001FB33B64|nr:spermatogenesis- and oogenesis-specific basic helix-loop-helix-containing protein 1 isoform X1 [Sciurus carolinensis]
MASRGAELRAGVPRVPGCRECSDSFLSGFLTSFQDPAQVPGRVKDPAVAQGPGSSLPRNVLSERERRRRISMSCERLRALLPRFDGRREDMASVLEMAVQFLRLTHTLVPGWEQHAVPAPSRETWHRWREEVLQLTLASQIPASGPDRQTEASGMIPPRDPLSCVTLAVDKSEVLNRPPSLPESFSLVPQPPRWPPCSQLPSSPETSQEAPGALGQAGPPARVPTSPGGLAEEAALTAVADARSVSGSSVEDGTSFLLTASPDWWLGSLEGRGSTAVPWAPARSSLAEQAEPTFLGDPEPGSQELQDGPLELWGSDLGSWGLELREEVDGIFPDFFAC